jgi:hypothetical protein
MIRAVVQAKRYLEAEPLINCLQNLILETCVIEPQGLAALEENITDMDELEVVANLSIRAIKRLQSFEMRH